jgi:hypothetical protein
MGLSDALAGQHLIIGVSAAALLSGQVGITDAATATPITTPTAAICPPTELRQDRQPSDARCWRPGLRDSQPLVASALS